MRNSHPLDFASELLQKTYSIIHNIAEKHETWRLQDIHNETDNLVPHGVKLFLERSEQASQSTVTRIGNGGVVTTPYHSGSEIKFRSKKTVDMDNNTCTCGMWNVDLFPCACAIAVAVSLGKVAAQFVASKCHQSYFLQATALSDIAKTLKPLLAPASEELEIWAGLEKMTT
jgi:phage pi2 protein 07